jgi:hypothetical protein
MSAARFMARLRICGDISPVGWLKKPGPPLATHPGLKICSHSGSI